ncbi:MAG: RDD family protein [Gemmatimonadota bacterium]|nr:MAG: RDD family protein [Gemmatimonadota bacterium]
MRYRQCRCGQLVEERFSVCPACKSDLTAPQAESQSPQAQPALGSAARSYDSRESQTWYYMSEGRMLGPCDADEFQLSLASGLIAPDTLVWAPGMKEWKPATEVMDLGDSVLFSPDLDDVEFGPAAGAATGPAAAAIADDPAVGTSHDPLASGYRATAPATPFAAYDAYASEAALADPGPHPWRRWFARIIDMTVAGFALGIVVGIFAPSSTIFDSSFAGTIFVLVFWMLAEPFVLVNFENTPGKALLNIHLKTAEGRSLKLDQAFRRSARVWFFGLAGGLPLISLFTMAASYSKLTREGITSWDGAESIAVSYGPVGSGRILGLVLFAVFYLLVTFIAALV